MESEYQSIYNELKAWWGQFGALTDAELRNIGSMASEIVMDAREAIRRDADRALKVASLGDGHR